MAGATDRYPEAGAARLRALTERRLSCAEAPLFAGGCFWAAALPDTDAVA
ncbi:TetR family transcriptional regulator C-terminal domain-containing protein [Streptomyces sp. NPDC048595]